MVERCEGEREEKPVKIAENRDEEMVWCSGDDGVELLVLDEGISVHRG
jgi:hypothetical protein